MSGESLEFDVLFVGAGPASLAGAIHLARLIEGRNLKVSAASQSQSKLTSVSIAVVEKGKEVGAHSLSGAVLDVRSLRELFEEDELAKAPIWTPVSDEALYYLTSKNRIRIPVPPPLRNHGCYVVSLGRLVKWLASVAEARGVEILPGFSASELLFEGGRVVGVRIGDKGLDKKGRPKPNYEPGVELRAKVTVLGEGARGSLTKVLVRRLKLDEGKNPQVYSLGIKELWQIPRGRIRAGTVIHTLGFPLKSETFGGGFIYALEETLVSVGLVVGLDYKDPFLDPHLEFQRFKTHPMVAALLGDGALVRYGAKAIPEGGYYALPKLAVDGALIIGDAAGFLNPQRLKGIHLAIKSGMLAAEAIFEALLQGDYSERKLEAFQRKFEASWARQELYRARNFHQGFRRGLWIGMLHALIQMLTGGRGLVDPMPAEPGHKAMRRISEYYRAGAPALYKIEFDRKLTFDRLTDVHFSGTRHEEDQPCHLIITDPDICHTRCIEEFGNPCQRFCPAAVYEMVDVDGQPRLQINASNCVHCKTCDIMDPYQVINWVPPEGGGGPNYEIL